MELEASARVAGTIAKDYSDFAEVRGLQMSGCASRIKSEPDRARTRQILEARYPFLKQTTFNVVRDSYERAQVYRFDIDRFVLTDNGRGFGHKDVLEHPRARAP